MRLVIRGDRDTGHEVILDPALPYTPTLAWARALTLTLILALALARTLSLVKPTLLLA